MGVVLIGMRTLFLSWQTHKPARQWFPVGRLDLVPESTYCYRFRYIHGAMQAQDQAKFPLLVEFPELDWGYKFDRLFPVFQNRVMRPTRPDFPDYVHSLGLTEDADAFDILSVSGGRRVTDPYGVFPKLEKDADENFTCRFFLNGSRHVSPKAQERIRSLRENESLHLELTHSAANWAVQIQTEDHQMIGWAPRYLATVLAAAPKESRKCSAKVVRNNTDHSYVNEQVLVEMRGRWKDHEPMSGEEFRPLVD